MSNELIINARPYETRVALVENGSVVELHIQRNTGQELIGNIYRGIIVRVLPGMQAAFVDIGLERTAFLYVSDVYKDFLDLEKLMLQNNLEEDEENSDDADMEPPTGMPWKIPAATFAAPWPTKSWEASG